MPYRFATDRRRTPRARPLVSPSQAAGWRADRAAATLEQRKAEAAAARCEIDREFEAAEQFRAQARTHANRAAEILAQLRRFNAEFA